MSRAREIADRDLAATELILDADNDTSITADTDDQIDFKIGGTDKMKLTSAGILDVTGSNSAAATSGTSQNGSLRLSQGGGNGVVDMGFDTTNTIGWIQATNKANLGTNYTLNLNPNSGDVKIGNGNLVIGTSGKGIDFSSNTQSAVSGVGNQSELFDFYEEGTWTPVPYGASTAGSVTSGSVNGYYTRIGRMVHIECRLTAIVLSGANGSYYIDGLPFTVGGTGYNTGAVSFYKVDLHDYSIQVNASGTTCYFLVTRDNTTWTSLDQSVFGSQHYLFFSVAYMV